MRRLIVFIILFCIAGAVYYRSLSLPGALKKKGQGRIGSEQATKQGKPGTGSSSFKGTKAAIPVAAITLGRGSIEERITLTGEVTPFQSVRIMPRISGFINPVKVREGSPVVAGKTLLATIDPKDYVLQEKSARASLDVVKATALSKELAYEEAGRRLKREQAMFKDKVSTEASLDEATYKFKAAGSDLNLAKAQLKKTEAELELASLKLSRTSIYCPIDGIVSQRFTEGSEQISQGTVIMTVVNVDKLQVTGEITESDYWKLAPLVTENNTPAAIVSSSIGLVEKSLYGKVRAISPVFNKLSRTTVVIIDVENKEKTLLPGMYVQVSILLRRIENALLLPLAAFCERDSGSGVFVIKDDIVTFIKPEIGIRSGNFIEVLSGLSKGDRLVTTGNHLVTDNSHVNVVRSDGVGK